MNRRPFLPTSIQLMGASASRLSGTQSGNRFVRIAKGRSGCRNPYVPWKCHICQSSAPRSVVMRIPSPVFPTKAALKTGLICQYWRCISGACSKPPQARITAFRAPTAFGPLPSSSHTPATAPLTSVMRRFAETPSRVFIPRLAMLSCSTLNMKGPPLSALA